MRDFCFGGRGMMLGRLALGAALIGVAGVPAVAQEEAPWVDAATGQDLAHWPPDRHFDFLHMKLEIRIPDMGVPRYWATETLAVAAIGKARERIELDAVGMSISSVRVNGRGAAFTHKDGKLVVEMGGESGRGGGAAVGRRIELTIDYTLEYAVATGNGVNWSAGKPEAENETDRAAQIHTQGEAEYARTWFVCHDEPNEKMTTELLVTVPDGFMVCSNGRLVGKTHRGTAPEGAPSFADVRDGTARFARTTPPPSARQASQTPPPPERGGGGSVGGAPSGGAPSGLPVRGWTTWHWLQDKPHPSYLVTRVVGKFEVVGVGGTGSARPGLALPVYTKIGTGERVKGLFAKTPDMVAFYEQEFAQPYPWDKYAQVIVRNFHWGGMENTSATTLHGGAVVGGPGSQDDLISHELAHQWTGDLVTCKSWEHAWLNEGWASICEALWDEHEAATSQKKSSGRSAYERKIYGFYVTERATNHTSAPVNPSMVSHFGSAEARFTSPDNIYSKGAMILHMLRVRLGAETFRAGTRLYLERMKYKCAETDDFRQALEEVSGQSLERFFDQWAKRPGLPRLAIELEWDEAGKKLNVVVEQTQKIDGDNPAYAFTLPLYVKTGEEGDGGGRYVYVDTDRTRTEASFALAAAPSGVEVDPHLSVLAEHRISKPLAMWIEDLRGGSTILARLQAAEQLGISEEPGAAAVLATVAGDEGADPLVRDVASRSLVLAWARDVWGRASAASPGSVFASLHH
jgi:aminopeptidase N